MTNHNRTTTTTYRRFSLQRSYGPSCRQRRMRRGNAFGHVCLSVCVCLSCSCSKFWKPWPVETSFLVRRQAYKISRSTSYIKVIVSRSRSREQKRLKYRNKMHTSAVGLLSIERKSCLLKCSLLRQPENDDVPLVFAAARLHDDHLYKHCVNLDNANYDRTRFAKIIRGPPTTTFLSLYAGADLGFRTRMP